MVGRSQKDSQRWYQSSPEVGRRDGIGLAPLHQRRALCGRDKRGDLCEVLLVGVAAIGPGLGIDPGRPHRADGVGDIVGTKPAGQNDGSSNLSTTRRLMLQS